MGAAAAAQAAGPCLGGDPLFDLVFFVFTKVVASSSATQGARVIMMPLVLHLLKEYEKATKNCGRDEPKIPTVKELKAIWHEQSKKINHLQLREFLSGGTKTEIEVEFRKRVKDLALVQREVEVIDHLQISSTIKDDVGTLKVVKVFPRHGPAGLEGRRLPFSGRKKISKARLDSLIGFKDAQVQFEGERCRSPEAKHNNSGTLQAADSVVVEHQQPTKKPKTAKAG